MECKRKTDGRKLDPKSKEVLRIRVVQQVQNGASPEELARALDINARTIYRWLEKHHAGGLDALRAKPIPGRPPKLQQDRVSWLARVVRTTTPREYGFPSGLWTLEVLGELIHREFGVRISEVTVGRILHSLGVIPKRPLQDAHKADAMSIDHWREHEYPDIRRLARDRDALIYFYEESGIRTNSLQGTGLASNDAPAPVSPMRRGVLRNVLSAVSGKGQFRFMIHEGGLTTETFCTFLGRLMEGADHDVFLVVDSHPLHVGSEVQKRVESFGGRLNLFFLPSARSGSDPDRQQPSRELAGKSARGPFMH